MTQSDHEPPSEPPEVPDMFKTTESKQDEFIALRTSIVVNDASMNDLSNKSKEMRKKLVDLCKHLVTGHYKNSDNDEYICLHCGERIGAKTFTDAIFTLILDDCSGNHFIRQKYENLTELVPVLLPKALLNLPEEE